MVRVTFLHPDLGIGGAERLVVDAALALKNKGHNVNFVTAHHDSNRCFDETIDGTLNIEVVGNWLPRSVFGKFYALCAYIRMIYAALYIIFFKKETPDIVFCDLVSACIPILKLRIPKVVFYCHYPDQLLTRYDSGIKRIYRIVLNYWEECTTGMADKIFVNSQFTQQVFRETFRRLDAIETEVLYPSINTHFIDNSKVLPLNRIFEDVQFPYKSCILLSINRYEVKKNLTIAIEALSDLKNRLSPEEYEKVYLIMAGGYDSRIEENVDYYNELTQLADEEGVANKVLFLKSPKDIVKVSLLSHCDILIYTPPNEHFGIVPLEAMYASKPVIAHNSGGPRETIVNNVTGYLAEYEQFSEKLANLIKNEKLRVQFGTAGHQRFIEKFSFEVFHEKLDNAIIKIQRHEKN